jgi:hypothetical protein
MGKKGAKKTLPSVSERAQRVLAAAEAAAKRDDATWGDVHNAAFGIGAVGARLFPTQADRTAFSQTREFAAIWALIEKLQGDGDSFASRLASAGGYLSVRIPKSLHAALLAEADEEGVSLNQLCAAKLALQLRAGCEAKAGA